MIHKTAIIDNKAKIASSVKVGAYTVIGPNVEIKENPVKKKRKIKVLINYR